MPNKSIKALQTFYGNFDEKLVEEGKELVVSEARAKELEAAGLAEISGDSSEEVHQELVINPVGPIAGSPLLMTDNVVNTDLIPQKKTDTPPTEDASLGVNREEQQEGVVQESVPEGQKEEKSARKTKEQK